jgi:hypothetical protein
MLENNRCLIIADNGETVAHVFFSICDDPEPYLNNTDYKYIEHNPNGKIVIVEGMICKDFKMKYLGILHDAFISKFPQLEECKWRRRKFPVDKIITFKRRKQHAIQY